MKVVLFEDEPHAAKRIEALLVELLPDILIVAVIDTVKKGIHYFNNNPAPDLALMDIHLADGISFDVFNHCTISCPVIFTTAYDEYALKAFKVNSIDYILKPIDKEELKNALTKFESLAKPAPLEKAMLANLHEAVRMLTKKYKTRFVIRVGEHLKTVEVNSIQYFMSQDKTTFCSTSENRRFILDNTLEDLEEMVDPQMFFRINRKYLVSAASISDIVQFTNSRLKLILRNSTDSDVVVAREKVQEFKAWLDK